MLERVKSLLGEIKQVLRSEQTCLIALPNSEILIHQPLIAGGGISGQCTDIKIHSDHMVKTREKLNRILAQNTGKPIEQINIDTERDNYMTAQEALEYGLIDKVITNR